MDAELVVALGFLCFVAAAVYYGAHSKLGAALDTRGQRIRDELAEAERYRKEAADLLISFEAKRAEAEKDAAGIVEQARLEAEMMAKDAEKALSEFVERRTAQAEAKIANAELQAMAQVRAAAADSATAAAEIVLRNDKTSGFAEKLLQQGIADVKRLKH